MINEKSVEQTMNWVVRDPGSHFFLSTEPASTRPAVYGGNQVRPLINASAYLQSLAEDLDRLGRSPDPHENEHQFFYLSGFVLNLAQPDAPILLPGREGPQNLLDLLIEKARAGVDVRVLIWIPWNLALIGRLDVRPESAQTMRSILALRQEPALAGKACLNIISHPAGSVHAKVVVLGDQNWAAGYTGGLDLAPDRVDQNWLDLQARVEGPAVQAFFDFYRQLWNQNLAFAGINGGDVPPTSRLRRLFRTSRPVFFRGVAGELPAVSPGTPPVETRVLPTENHGEHRIQSLQTLPVFKFSLSPLIPWMRAAPLQFAPQGVFQVQAATHQAILAAQQYIYIEDQYFWSAEVMRWINDAIRSQPDLKVILATGQSDQLGERLEAYRTLAVMTGLMPGLTEQQRQQITFVQRPEMLHAKTILVDDQWALIGSSNIARRSHAMDIEHSIAIDDLCGEFVSAYRQALWGSRLGLPAAEQRRLSDLNQALNLWNPAWGSPWQGPKIKTPYQRIYATIPRLPRLDFEWYEMVVDPDSRHPWHFPLRMNYARYAPFA